MTRDCALRTSEKVPGYASNENENETTGADQEEINNAVNKRGERRKKNEIEQRVTLALLGNKFVLYTAQRHTWNEKIHDRAHHASNEFKCHNYTC